MISVLRKASKWGLLGLLVASVFMTTGAAALAYQVTIGDGTGAPGSSGNPISITAASLPANLAGFQVYIKYNKNVLTPSTASLTIHPNFSALTVVPWTKNASIQVIDATYNRLNILVADYNVEGSAASVTPVTICTVTFSVAAGASTLNNPLEVEAGSPGLGDTNGDPVATTWVNGNFRITGIPTGAITLTPNPASIPADGTSTSTITSSAIKDAGNTNVPDGTKITVSSTAGTITTADADGTEPGTQVLTSGGVITFTLRSATTVGAASVTAISVAGDATGSTTVNFTAGPVSAGNSTVEVDKATTSVGTGGGDGITVTVTLKDANNNNIQGTEVFLSVTGTGNYINATAGNGPTSIGGTDASGVATGVIKSTKAEAKTISARGGATTITQTQAVTYTPLVAAGVQSVITAPLSPPTIAADGTATATVEFRDQYGNLTIDLGGAALAATGASLAGATWVVVDNTNGTATATYTPRAAGSETGLKITLGGVQIGANQAVTVTAGAATAAQSEIVAALNPATITADATATATVQFNDQYGNPTTNLGGMALAASGATLTGATWAVVNNGGTATATYTPGAIGNETALQITLGGAQIGANQSVTVTPGVATAAQSQIIAALAPATITADQTATATVQFKDQKGNNTSNIGGATLAASGATLAGATWAVVNNGGTATATYTPKTVGNETALQITLGGVRIGADQSVTVTPGDAASIFLAPDGLKVASGGKGTAQLTATVRDAKGNTKTDLPPTTITFTVTGAGIDNAGWTTNADDTENGVATVTFTTKDEVPAPGTTTVNVQATNNGFTSNTIGISIVNFSATADFYALVTTGTPKQANITAVGATNYTWEKVSGPGTLTPAGATAVFRAPDTIAGGTSGDATVIKVTDADNVTVSYSFTITTYEPVRFTAPTSNVGITHDGAIKTYQLQVAGGNGTYSYQVEDGTTNVIEVSGTGLVTGKAVGAKRVYVWDGSGAAATDNSFRALSFQIEVVNAVVVTPATTNLLASETQQFAAAGGKGGGAAANYTWSVNNAGAGSVNANGLFTAANVTVAQTATITATDQTYTNILGTATVNVYPTLTIKLPEGYDPNNPATWPLVLPGGTYNFEVLGGEGSSYTWSVTGPLPVAGGTGNAFEFVAPTDGAFAGVYTVQVTDDQTGKTFSINVKVPMTITPSNLSMLGDSTLIYEFDVAGAPEGSSFAVSLVTTGKAEIANPDEYGTVTYNPNEFFSAEALAGFDFTPADITGAYKSFLFKVQATEVVNGNGAPLKDAGLDILYSGVMNILPVVEFTGRVENADGDPIENVDVKVLLGDDVVEETTTDVLGEFSLRIADPASIGEITAAFTAAGYVTQAVPLEGWVNPKVIVLIAAVGSVSGNVSEFEGGPIAGAVVESALDDQDLAAVTDNDGNYTLGLPRALAEGEVLNARASKLGYVAVVQDAALNPDFILNPQSEGPEQEVCEAGGTLEWDSAIVEIPAGALDGCYTIEVNDNIPVGTETLYTEKSVVLIEIKIPPAALPLAKPIIVTMPYDTAEVQPGDFKAGIAVIYHAPTVDDLRNGTNLKKVATSAIISQDPFSGLVTFQVSDFSVFGIGGAQAVPTPTPSGGGGGGGGCFIDTLTGASGGGWFAPLMLMAFAAGAEIIRRAAR